MEKLGFSVSKRRSPSSAWRCERGLAAVSSKRKPPFGDVSVDWPLCLPNGNRLAMWAWTGLPWLHNGNVCFACFALHAYRTMKNVGQKSRVTMLPLTCYCGHGNYCFERIARWHWLGFWFCFRFAFALLSPLLSLSLFFSVFLSVLLSLWYQRGSTHHGEASAKEGQH